MTESTEIEVRPGLGRTVYVVGGSTEAASVASFIANLRLAGFRVTYDWTISVLKNQEHGMSDRDLEISRQREFARHDLYAVCKANYVWYVIPKKPSEGASFEFGVAILHGERFGNNAVFVSGDYNRSIFMSLADYRFDTHEEALMAFLKVEDL